MKDTVYTDVLGNVVRVKTCKDTEKEVKGEPCWIVKSRKEYPQKTDWHRFSPLRKNYYTTEEDAFDSIRTHILDMEKLAATIGRAIKHEFT